MAYINTGYARNKTLTVTKGSYSQTYDITAGFMSNSTTYPSLSDSGFAQLTEEEYKQRLADFIDYVYSQENGLSSNCPNMDEGSVVWNPTLCQLPGVQQEEEES